jgi:hypothetical protein
MTLNDQGKPLIIPAAQKSLIARWVPVSIVTY